MIELTKAFIQNMRKGFEKEQTEKELRTCYDFRIN